LNVEKPNRTQNIVPYVKKQKKKVSKKTLVPSDPVPSHLSVETAPVKDGCRERERELQLDLIAGEERTRERETWAGGDGTDEEGWTAGREKEREREREREREG
jgi:hypothetical protein